MKVSELPDGENVFVDANIYLFNALDDPRWGEASTRFLEMIERGEINAVTNDFFTKNRVKTALRVGASDILFRKWKWCVGRLDVSIYHEKIDGALSLPGRIAQTDNCAKLCKRGKDILKEFGMTFIVADDADFKGVDLVEVVELGVL